MVTAAVRRKTKPSSMNQGGLMCMSAMAPLLCKASLEDQETRQNLRFQRFPLVSQPVSKPLPEKIPVFLAKDSPS